MKAICLSCGEGKWGALTSCRRCGHHPDDPENQARHLLCSAEHLDEEGLAQMSRRVRKGEPLGLDEEGVSALAAEIESVGPVPIWFAVAVVALPIGVLGLGLLLLVGLLS